MFDDYKPYKTLATDLREMGINPLTTEQVQAHRRRVGIATDTLFYNLRIFSTALAVVALVLVASIIRAPGSIIGYIGWGVAFMFVAAATASWIYYDRKGFLKQSRMEPYTKYIRRTFCARVPDEAEAIASRVSTAFGRNAVFVVAPALGPSLLVQRGEELEYVACWDAFSAEREAILGQPS
jgi:hypothetical protein